MKDTLRLILFGRCNRNCEGCCNKDFDIDKLPVPESFDGYKQVILTGGEPMLKPILINMIVKDIKREAPETKIILYTAKVDDYVIVEYLLNYLNGITVTLHEQDDVHDLIKLSSYLKEFGTDLNDKTLRLNIFEGIELPLENVDEIEKMWQIKKDIKWIKNCPLPSNEVLMRL